MNKLDTRFLASLHAWRLAAASTACLTAMVSASGCGLIQNLNQMHDATMDMDQKTTAMNDKMSTTNQGIVTTNSQMAGMVTTTDTVEALTQQLATLTAELAGMTAEIKSMTAEMNSNVTATTQASEALYQKLLQGNSAQLRSIALHDMDEIAKTPNDKISDAGIYFKSFQFQLWDPSFPGATQDELAAWYHEAGQQFTRDLTNYMDMHTAPESRSISPTSTDNKMEDLYALSVALQELNTDVVIKSSNGKAFKPLNMYDLIKGALSGIAADQGSGEVPEQDYELQNNSQSLEYLLQVRMNFFIAMTAVNVSTNLMKTGLPGEWADLKDLLSSWHTTLGTLDLAQLQEYTRYLYGSNETRDFLASIKVAPRLDATISRILDNMSLSEFWRIAPASTQAAPATVTEAIAAFKDQFEIFKGYKKFQKLDWIENFELNNP